MHPLVGYLLRGLYAPSCHRPTAAAAAHCGELASGTAVGSGAVAAGAGGWGYCPADFEAQLRWRVGGALSHMPTGANKLDEDFQNGTCQF